MRKITKYILISASLLVFSFFVLGEKAEASTEEITFGSAYNFNSASTSLISLVKLSESKFVAVYQDGGGGLDYGRVLVAEVSDKEITFGSEYDFNPTDTSYISAASLSEDKFVVAYKDDGGYGYGRAVIGQVSDNSIAFGEEFVFNGSVTNFVSVAALSENKFVVAYDDEGAASSNQGRAIIGTVNDKDISFGSEYTFESGEANGISIAALSSTKFIVAYRDVVKSNQGTVIVGDISGEEIDFGSEYVFNPTDSNSISLISLSETKFVVAYDDEGESSEQGRAVAGTIDNNVINLGSEYIFNPGLTDFVSVNSFSHDKIIVVFQDEDNSNYGKVVIGDISGEEIDFGSEYVFNSTNTSRVFVIGLSNSKFVAAYQHRGGNLNYGRVVIGTIPEPEPAPEPEPEPEPASKEEVAEEETTSISISDGDLIRNPNAEGVAQFDVYIVKLVGDKKFKRLILSPHVFESYEHLEWDNIKDVDQSIIDQYTISDLVRPVNGTKVYQLSAQEGSDTGVKQWLDMTTEEFIVQYDSDSIYTINATDLDAYSF